MLEFRSILAPTDFSEHASKALRYAAALAERFGATLHLLHVLPEVVPMAPDLVAGAPDLVIATALPPEYYRDTEAESLEALGRVLDPSWGAVASVERAVRLGDPVEEIIDYAAEQRIDLIVIATHGRTGLGHVLLGSVAEQIVRHSPCPVLTIRDRTT
ncbi:MAG TPA: universal stress protein [Isosphaeraceae bacterium]